MDGRLAADRRAPVMTRRLSSLIIAAALASGLAAARADEIRACDFKLKSGCVAGDAKITLADGRLQHLEFDIVWCGLHKGAPGYTCMIDAARSDGESKWSDDAGATIIAGPADTPAQPDNIKVTVGRFVSIDFSRAQSGNICGAGAELPRALVIPEKTGRPCRVFLSPDEQ
jgi:hypothetical protein